MAILPSELINRGIVQLRIMKVSCSLFNSKPIVLIKGHAGVKTSKYRLVLYFSPFPSYILIILLIILCEVLKTWVLRHKTPIKTRSVIQFLYWLVMFYLISMTNNRPDIHPTFTSSAEYRSDVDLSCVVQYKKTWVCV